MLSGEKKLSVAQFNLLDSFIGSEGSCITTILEAEEIDQYTKLLYLERAITQKKHGFF